MYQALYRKYRPQTFDDVVGQKHITDTLKAQLSAGKMSHAYLFTGTRGTGKTTCAKILAKAVNCLDPHDGNPCNQCEACRAIDSGACVDVLEIDAASNNGVENIRALREEAVYSPSQVNKRVYIVDEVHMLSGSAFNALLKIMEEPPAHLLFILATTELHKVPATILSRCQRYSFRRLQPEDIASRLGYVAYQEGLNLEPSAGSLLAVLADGALRDGLSLLDQCASATAGRITEETVCTVLGLAGEKRIASLLHAVGDKDTGRALTEFSALYAAGKDLNALLSEMSTLARDLLLMRTAPQSGKSMLSGLCSPQEREALLKKFSPAQLLHLVATLQKTASGFAVSANPRLDAELCLMELCCPELSLDAQALSARVGKLEEQMATGSFVSTPQTVKEAPKQEKVPEVSTPAPRPAPQPAPQPMGELPSDFWPEFQARIRGELPPQLRSFFLSSQVRPNMVNGVLYMEAENDFVRGMIEQADYAILSQKASALLKRTVTVRPGDKRKYSAKNADPMEELLQFGGEHEDIITITK